MKKELEKHSILYLPFLQMTNEQLNTLKEDKSILYIYKIPCSLNNNFQYVIIGDTVTKYDNYDCYFKLDDWFSLLDKGSLLPYVCSTIGKRGKIKESINIYKKPDLLALRKYILTESIPEWRLFQEILWAKQIQTEFKINRPDVFKIIKFDTESTKKYLQDFLRSTDNMYKKKFEERHQ